MWRVMETVAVCKECGSDIYPSDPVWVEPKTFVRAVTDTGGIYCKDCGEILDLDGTL